MSISAVRVILVETTHPGNIGGAARAMKTMGLSELYLVNPQRYPSAEATARASGADDVLAGARVCDSLPEAVEGCSLVVGASARARTLPWPVMEPRECAARLVAERVRAPVALVFGREHSGLTNEELAYCNYHVHIPANPAYSSLNLAAAVQIMAYEIMMAAREPTAGEAGKGEPPATAEEVERFYGHLQEALVDIGFLDPDNPRHLMRRLRRLFNRVHLEVTEVNILRGILTAAQGKKGPGRQR